VLLSRKVSSQSTDLDIANFALILEYLEAESYGLALAGVLSGDALSVVTNLYEHKVHHMDAIIGLLKGAGATPVAKPEFVFPEDAFTSQTDIYELAATFEPLGVGAYLGAAPLIRSPDSLAAAGGIAGVEGEHVVAVTTTWCRAWPPPSPGRSSRQRQSSRSPTTGTREAEPAPTTITL
jgi:hypothetical protein